MTVVVDASAAVAALIDAGADGAWAEAELSREDLAAPCLMPVEAANILRRAALAGDISSESASLAHHDLLSLPIALFPYEPTAERAWELRGSLTMYDASYVALAEALEAPVVTLDHRMARAAGPRCPFRIPVDRQAPGT